MDYQTVIIVEDAIQIVEAMLQGPTGPQGPAGSAQAVNYVAATNISGHQAFVLDASGQATPADTSTPGHQYVEAITYTAAVAGASLQGVKDGQIEHLGWTFTPNQPVYLGLLGSITQTVPEGAVFVKVLGTAVSATRINLDFQPAIFL